MWLILMTEGTLPNLPKRECSLKMSQSLLDYSYGRAFNETRELKVKSIGEVLRRYIFFCRDFEKPYQERLERARSLSIHGTRVIAITYFIYILMVGQYCDLLTIYELLTGPPTKYANIDTSPNKVSKSTLSGLITSVYGLHLIALSCVGSNL